ncbi:type IV toxin-antitoxin system AbiEi family antitoxin domain-containing protein [Anaerosacchariphilus polymeriproducens]|uniref:Abortive infection protein n=1 Tax=Anaerosacchariphilus polymeriproducens TaxID=1812858 RepID=A0A371AWN5_9FIRM|nr:hypothetical protein [Anaerosacchariphilus polymeriproducens]RDU23880.1 hypothetical protein DWV06_07300 [Anaerosacchariphilus polymeriproducens]
MKNDIDLLEKTFLDNHGILKTSQLNALNYGFRGIQALMDKGYITKIKNGYYQWTKAEKSSAMIVAGLFPDAVLFMDSALFYYGYSDIRPVEWHLAVDKNTSKVRFRLEYPFIKPYYVEPEVLKLGVDKAEFNNSFMNIYDRDRLICDCIKYEAKIQKELYINALQGYIRDEKKNISNLREYSKIRKVDKKVSKVLGVWL